METANRHHANRPTAFYSRACVARRPGLFLAVPLAKLLAFCVVLAVML